jgi:predicted aspartyl protease
MKIKFLIVAKYSFLIVCFIIFKPPFLSSEFYQYIDKDGVKSYTDDPSLVSDIDDKKLTIHKDKYDDLDETEKKKLRDQEEQETFKSNQESQEAIELFIEDQRINEERKTAGERFRNRTTPVKIERNRTLVPVTIGYSGRELTTELILDTGTSITVIYDFVADQLEINTGKVGAAKVASGSIVKAKIVEIEYIKVGPKTYKTPTIMVLNRKGPATASHGLIGQDFLSYFEYTIDYSNNLIVLR